MDDRWNLLQNQPFSRLNARERAYAICNPESFTELLGPRLKLTSPHLPPMGQTPQFDDGVVVGLGTVGKAPAVVVSQESKFLGGGVGEALPCADKRFWSHEANPLKAEAGLQ